nr:hypothetical protein [Deltaproteobacteria bacterium]
MKRQRERGTAILITIIVIVALLGGGAVLVGMQIGSTRSTEVARSNMTALYCAEAGLNAARKPVLDAYTPDGTWGNALGTGTQPTYVNNVAIDHDLDPLDSLTTDDFQITLVDNDDEIGFTATPLIDNDLQIYVVSTCLKFPENKKQVKELIKFKVAQQYYNAQAGGIGGNNNANPNP